MASSERTEATGPAASAPSASASASGTAAAATAGQAHREVGQADAGLSPRPMAVATSVEKRTVSCLMNAHYHAGREAFLDTIHRWFMFLVIVLGATALTDAFPKLFHTIFGWVIEPALFKELCAAGAAILAALDLTFDLSNRARSHAMMKRRYFELLADLRSSRKTPEEVGVCLDQYSADEEPPYKVLLLASWNAAQRTVFGRQATQCGITKWGLLWKNFLRRPAVHYPMVEPKPG